MFVVVTIEAGDMLAGDTYLRPNRLGAFVPIEVEYTILHEGKLCYVAVDSPTQFVMDAAELIQVKRLQRPPKPCKVYS